MKIQNLGVGGPTSNVSVCGQSGEQVAEFTYLGSVQSVRSDDDDDDVEDNSS